jgi:hypothetical protein
MKFARVQGHGSRSDSGAIRLVITLDNGTRSEVVRQETLPWLEFGPAGDVAWQIDQYTQETIGSQLADLGWEAISEDTRNRGLVDDGFVHSATYVVRQMSVGEADQ